MTKIVNLRLDKYDVYCGRAGKGQDGFLGNNHIIGYCGICKEYHNREQCVEAFKKDFDKRIVEDPEYKKRVLELKDKVLGCFCKLPDKEVKCHCDVYVGYLDSIKNNE